MDKIYYVFDVIVIILLVYMSARDMREQIIPNKSVLIFLVVAAASGIYRVCAGETSLMYLIISGAVIFIPLMLRYNIKRTGAGDIKLLTVLALYMGIINMLPVILVSMISSVLYLVITRKKLKEKIPLAPHISIGAIAVILLNILIERW